MTMPRVSRPSSPARHPGGVRGWLRHNVWSLLTVAGVMGALLATVAVVRGRAGEKDNLRRAQIALAAAPGAPSSSASGDAITPSSAPAGPSEFPLSKLRR